MLNENYVQIYETKSQNTYVKKDSHMTARISRAKTASLELEFPFDRYCDVSRPCTNNAGYGSNHRTIDTKIRKYPGSTFYSSKVSEQPNR